MAPSWVFPATGNMQVQGRDLSEDNFAQEDKTGLEILMREALQNPLDARDPDNVGPVQVRMKVLQAKDIDTEYLNSLITPEFRDRLKASGGESQSAANASVLVLEDFGTTGLQGTFSNVDADGPNENWNAFWFREGEGAKSTLGSNGRAGQGKITYYRMGMARAVFGLTVRKSDGKPLLMGRSAFRRVYPYGGKKYLRHSFWSTDSEQALPVTNTDDVQKFEKAFKLARGNIPGLSLVIPYPIDFDAKDAIRTIVAEFYYPIARRRLEVIIGEVTIGASNLDALADMVLTDEIARKKKSAFTKGFRALVRSVIDSKENKEVLPLLKDGWEKKTAIGEDNFEAGTVEKLRDALEKGNRVSVRCPVPVRRKNSEPTTSYFEIHLELPDSLDQVEEAYIRRDLLIGSERHLTSTIYLQKARGLTLIEDDTLSAFMADAEEPTHLKWNASRPRLAEDYANPSLTVRAVRLALPRLLAFLSGGIAKRDVKALAKYFRKPVESSAKRTPGGKKPGDKDTKPSSTPPPPIRKPFRIETGKDSVRVVPNGSAGPAADQLPISCLLEVAYEGLDLNPFQEYDPFDFNLGDTKSHPILFEGATISVSSENRIEFVITSPSFFVEVSGFDPNIRLRARLGYTESDNGSVVGTE
jgi:hypothetical protein